MHVQYDLANSRNQSRKRAFCRGAVTIPADIRVAGSNKIRVQILDLSQTGFRMECLTCLTGSKAIFLTIPSFQQLESRIIWQTEWIYGCQFAQPLHAAVYDHIVRTFPTLNDEETKNSDGMIYGAAASQRWAAAQKP